MPPKLPKSLQVLLAKLKQAITDIFDRFEEGELTAVKWRDSMKSILTRFITASFMSGQESPLIGVTEQGYIYEYIKAQLGFIDNFYLSIVSSDEFKTGWRQRAESYANSIVAPFWKGETKMVALPAMPGDMTTPCGQLCACLWDVKAIDEEKGDYDAYWLLNASREIETEHCQICEQRSKEWNPLKIRDNMLVIPQGEAGKEFIEHIQEHLGFIIKGGPGSGNFGHAGRPGEVGGSAMIGETSSIWKEGDTRYSIDAPSSVQGHTTNLTDGEIKSIELYTSSAYKDLNTRLANGIELTDIQQQIYNDLNSAIDKTPRLSEPITVLRGVRTSTYTNIDNRIANYENRISEEITMPGFQSSSFYTEPVLDAVGSKGYIFEIVTNKGIYINNVSKYKDESEFLLGHNWKYRILGVERNGKFEVGDYQDIVVRPIVKLEVIE